ncbi:MAG TPA: hypothetical protein VGK74_05750 [Symbiobacteriaceae bacterium]|jgi:protein-tyrosine-phosphatase
MIGETGGTTAARSTKAGESAGSFGFKGLDPKRFAVEVAGEIGLDPNNLGAHGLTPERVRQYESGLHGATQKSGGR